MKSCDGSFRLRITFNNNNSCRDRMNDNDIKECFYGLLSGASRRRLTRSLVIKMVRMHPFLQTILMQEAFQLNGSYQHDASNVLLEWLRGPVPFHRLTALYGDIPAHAPSTDHFAIVIGSKLIRSRRFCTSEGRVLRELLRSQVAHAFLRTGQVTNAIATASTVVSKLRQIKSDTLAKAVKAYAQTVWSLGLFKKGELENAAKLSTEAMQTYPKCGGTALLLKLRVIVLNTWAAQMIVTEREPEGIKAVMEALAIVEGLSAKAMATSIDLAAQLTIVATALHRTPDGDKAWEYSLAAWKTSQSTDSPLNLVVISAAAKIYCDTLGSDRSLNADIDIHLLLLQRITPFAKLHPNFFLSLYLTHLVSFLRAIAREKHYFSGILTTTPDLINDPDAPTRSIGELAQNEIIAAIDLLKEARARGYNIERILEAQLRHAIVRAMLYIDPSAAYQHAVSALRRLRGLKPHDGSLFFLARDLRQLRIESNLFSLVRSAKQFLWHDYAKHRPPWPRGQSSQSGSADGVPNTHGFIKDVILETWLALYEITTSGSRPVFLYVEAEVMETRCLAHVLTLTQLPQRDFFAEGVSLLMLAELQWALGKARLARRTSRSAIKCFSKVSGGHPRFETAVYHASVLIAYIDYRIMFYSFGTGKGFSKDKLRTENLLSLTVRLTMYHVTSATEMVN